MKSYLLVIFAGIIATSLYNYFSCLLRALGNSTIPLVFLAVSAILNIGLDLLFIAVLPWGIRGAAFATVIAQYVSGIGITLYVLLKCRDLLPSRLTPLPIFRCRISAMLTLLLLHRVEGSFYCGIGCLFLLYGYYRAVKKPGMSVVLTVISLGTHVALAYLLSAYIGEIGIWMAIPIGWVLADAVGLIHMKFHKI